MARHIIDNISTHKITNCLAASVLRTIQRVTRCITTDTNRRYAQHVAGKGAKYFRVRTPLRIVYLEEGHNRSSASRREAEIKRLSATEKRLLVALQKNPHGDPAAK